MMGAMKKAEIQNCQEAKSSGLPGQLGVGGKESTKDDIQDFPQPAGKMMVQLTERMLRGEGGLWGV